MSHNERIESLLRTRPYVPISEIRTWSNYRSRISEIRAKVMLEGLNIKSIKVWRDDLNRYIHAYELVRVEPEPVKEEFKVEANGQRSFV
uniref:Uncharacterized protein n=1 Tax=viral metagenome TaxID=1070528 RepID=A0A6H1ZWD7_9ZZZZ